MARMPSGRLLALIVFAAVALLNGAAAVAQPRELSVAVSAAKVVEFPKAARSVFIADPAIADIQVSAPTSVIVFGRKPGQTTLIAIGNDDKPLANVQIIVGYNYADLKRMIARDVPGAAVNVKQTPSGIVLTGTVPNDETAEKVRAIAQRYVSEKDTVNNEVKVAGPAQVNLRVRVAEISRSLTKQLGFNWETLVSPGAFTFGVFNGRQFLSNPIGGSSTILQGQSLSGLTSSAPPNSLFSALNTSHATVNSLIDALAEEGIVTVLAQPNLTAESGQSASFLAGGEFPIPVSQTAGTAGAAPTVTIEFKEFGVRLDFVPTVLSSDRISIKVRPEVSELNTTNGVTLPGNLVVPGLNVRRAETTIRLGSGESFAIAGLIQKGNNTDISKFPGLGDVPVIGPLFRSSRFQHNETELVIIVTPYVVRPVTEGASLKLPTDGMEPASDVEQIFLDRLTKIAPPGGRVIGPSGVRLMGDAGFIYK